MIIYTARDRTPYTYLIGWSKINLWYYGVRWAKGCHPSDLWVKYFTSSLPMHQAIEFNGQPDIIEVRMIFNSAKLARKCEGKVLRKFKVWNNQNWLNQVDNSRYFTRINGKRKINTPNIITPEAMIKKREHGKVWAANTSQYMKEATPEFKKEVYNKIAIGVNVTRFANREKFSNLSKIAQRKSTNDGKAINFSNNGLREKLMQIIHICPHCFKSGNFCWKSHHFHRCKSLPYIYDPNETIYL